jgi:putative NADH-flavin reductase
MTWLLILLAFAVYAVMISIALGRHGFRRSPTSTTASRYPFRPQRALKVLVIGATGGTGRQLVSQTLERGHDVTALVRNPAALHIQHPRLRALRGNVLDLASTEDAMRGQDAVLCALGHKQFLGPTRILSNGTRNLLRAMETHGVHRLVCETALGIGDSAGRMGLSYTFFVIPVILPFYFWDKTRQERLIASSDVEWIIVRPAALTNGAPRGTYRHGSDIGSLLWTERVARADVADFMLNQLHDDTYLRSAAGLAW